MGKFIANLRVVFKYLPFGLCFMLFTIQVNGQESHQVKTIVLDAGHGGHDSGCRGKHSKEKHIALKLVLLIGSYIEAEYPDVKVIYTRKKDVFVTLRNRANLANKNKADLFVSIHCNAASSNAYGSETFVLGLHREKDNLEVVSRENSVIEMEEGYEQHYRDLINLSEIERFILSASLQSSNHTRSIQFADLVEEEMRNIPNRFSRGVKQAGFLVLRATSMPSVLVESGFLTNMDDETLLRSKEGQKAIAQAVVRAFKRYKAKVEEGVKTEVPKEVKPEKIDTVDVVKVDTVIVHQPTPIHVKPTTTIPVGIQFKVQLAASSVPINLNEGKWSTVIEIDEVYHDGVYRYLAAGFTSYKKANRAKTRLRKGGFKGAFVVAYEGADRIDVKEALRKSNGAE